MSEHIVADQQIRLAALGRDVLGGRLSEEADERWDARLFRNLGDVVIRQFGPLRRRRP